MNDIGQTRPDCQICNKKECAMMLVNSQIVCGECAMKFEKWKKEKENKELEEFKNAIHKY